MCSRPSTRAPTFLFSVGPDHTGRAIKRVFRPGFMGKVKRTIRGGALRAEDARCMECLLPGPHIGRRCRSSFMLDIARRGFEVGVHTYDHIKWQDGVARANEPWTRRELMLALEEFVTDFRQATPVVHGAAGWQVNAHVPSLEAGAGDSLCVRHARSRSVPAGGAGAGVAVPQIPTTLPTLDELIGRRGSGYRRPEVDHLLGPDRGGRRSAIMSSPCTRSSRAALFWGRSERLPRTWRARGVQLTDLATYAGTYECQRACPGARFWRSMRARTFRCPRYAVH